jgi:phosphoribulokinase
MPRPVMLGIVGDSGSGKTTITRGLVRVLGADQITHFCTDDYHRYDRRQRAERNITPLHPDCNHLDILAQHLRHLRANEPIMKPVYQHTDGTFGPPDYFDPGRFLITEGLLALYNTELQEMFDVRVYLAPPEELRRQWKVQRDCSRRGYTTDQVLDELDRREPDSVSFIRPQQRWADIVVSFSVPEGDTNQDHLDAAITLRDNLEHPDLTSLIDGNDQGMRITEAEGETRLWIPGGIEGGAADDVEGAIWDRMHFASHLRSERLGEFTIGTELHRSESLALVQMLLLYHLFTATASVALGGSGTRVAAPEGVPS